MEIVRFRDDRTPDKPVVATIGNFDGMHLGHRALVDSVLKEAQIRQAVAALVTFDPHPQEVLHPDKTVSKICTPEHRVKLFEEAGLDIVHIIPFTREFSCLSPEEFVQRFLMEHFNLKQLVIGHDFHFGKNRAGNAERLKQIGQAQGFDVQKVSAVEIGGQTVSSTLIRKLIQEGRFKEIPEYLGRFFSIYGPISHGDHRGRTLGLPTANIYPNTSLAIPNGVYVTEIHFPKDIRYGITNIGVKPTFGKNQFSVETLIFEFQQEIYGNFIEVRPLKFLRSETTFPDAEALRKQIHQDMEQAHGFLDQQIPGWRRT
ncbi:MAG: bifunctional riboflavin kinase/FAD synthetase [SAR324 cluster bacterium]|nr:bifunctional riboflavin kinase/FAD synthetase [SAR324 cluster bacterium]